MVENSIYNIIYKVITALYPLVAVSYVSHVLMSEKMGMVSYAQNIVSYFVVFAALGIPTYGIRETAVRAENKTERSQLFGELFAINFLSTSVALLAYFFTVMSIDKFAASVALYFVAGLQIAFNYLNVDWFFQGMEEYKYISIRSIIVKLIALIALPIAIRTPNDYIYYALIYCLAIAGNNIFNIIRIRNYISKPIGKIRLRRHMKSISVLLMVSVAVEIYAMIDTTMLGFYCDDSTVGCYSNAMKLTRMVNTTAAAIGAVLFPRLSVIYNNNNKEEFNKLVNMGIQIMLMIAFPAAVGMILCSESIVMVLFGKTFLDAVPILRILALMVPIVVCNTLMGGQVLVTTNQENKYVITVVIASAVNVILNTMFIPKYGASSAAFASLISELIDLVLYCFFARRNVILSFTPKYILSIFLPLALYASISILIINSLISKMIIKLLVNIIACGILYFGIGYIMGNETMRFCIGKIVLMSRRK